QTAIRSAFTEVGLIALNDPHVMPLALSRSKMLWPAVAGNKRATPARACGCRVLYTSPLLFFRNDATLSAVRHRPSSVALVMSSIFVIVSFPRKRVSRLPASSTRLLGARRDLLRILALRLVWTCPSQWASQAVQA